MRKICWVCGRTEKDLDKIDVDFLSPFVFIKKETDFGKVFVCIPCIQIMASTVKTELKEIISGTDIMEAREDDDEEDEEDEETRAKK